MKCRIIFFVATVCAISAINANGQAVDSTGMDKLSGISTRVENFIPAAIPGPAGATGATGATGETGAAGGTQQGTTCGVATLERRFNRDGESGWEDMAWRFQLVSSCMGYRIAYNVGKVNYKECPPSYVAAVISKTGRITEAGGGDGAGTIIYETWSCIKT